MALQLQQLIEKVDSMDISLIAGDKGLSNLVTWIHMVETTEASEFLVGGEIAFTTGLGINNKMTLLQLVEHIYSKKAAGIIVNIGPFLETVTPDVIDFCNAHDFPLFLVPWKIHLAEIMRIFSFAITKDEQKNLEIAVAFKNAISFPQQEELYVVPLSQHHFHVNWQYACTVIQIDHMNGAITNRLEHVINLLDHYLAHHYIDYSLFLHEYEIILVTGNYSESLLRELIDCVIQQLNTILLHQEEMYLGVGKLTRSIRCLYKSFRQAQNIKELQAHKKIDPSMFFYSDLGIYKLLMAIDDKEILKDYYEKTIFPLFEYDKQHNSDLTQILQCYLKHNGSVKETSDELFVHRNTINYKLNKIEELLHVNLSSLETRLQISVGFMLKDMM